MRALHAVVVATATLLLLCPLSMSAAAQSVRPFPLRPAGPVTDDGSLPLQPRHDELQALAGLTDVTLLDVPWLGGPALTVRLTRLPIAAPAAVLHVNGRPAPAAPIDADISLWSGDVVGESASEVYLALSIHGSQGWVRRSGELQHLVSRPQSGARWVAESALAAPAAPLCGSDRLTGVHGRPAPRLQPASAADGGPLPTYEARVAIETDFQFYELFGDLDAARAYAVALLGAVNSRYRDQVGVVISVPYLGLYTANVDPWESQDNGGNSIDVLYEFRDAWGGLAGPVDADLYHLVSGASLGGGVAWLSVLCNDDYGFAVSGNLGGNTPLPVVPGPLNWDFVVVAHEFGHNFGAIHTHDYCPPVDSCAPDGYFGACQTSQVCTTSGSIMSYCHLCDGGFLNETTYFHALSAADMRAQVEASCLSLFSGPLTTSLGFAKPGSGGLPALSLFGSADPDTLHLAISAAPASKPGTLFVSNSLLLAPFKGGTLVPAAQFAVPLASNGAGAVSLSGPLAFGGWWGLTLYAQAWFADGGPLAATNGVALQFLTP